MRAAIIDLDQALDEIMERCSKEPRPFFFMAGAGISADTIKMADGVIDDCKKELKRRGARVANYPREVAYFHYVADAFPDPTRRARYFRDLIGGKALSRANRLLAEILNSSTIASIFVTTNFDDHTERAARQLGATVLPIDAAATAHRLKPASSDLQCWYLHGKFVFETASTEAEVDRQKRVKAKVVELLTAKSPIVIGYAGYDDVFTAALEKSLIRRKGNDTPVFWFCYHASQISRLPHFLRNSERVRFVVRSGSALPARDVFYGLRQRLQSAGHLPACEPEVWYIQPANTNAEPSDCIPAVLKATLLRFDDLPSDELQNICATLLDYKTRLGSEQKLQEQATVLAMRAAQKASLQCASFIDQALNVRAIAEFAYTLERKNRLADALYACNAGINIVGQAQSAPTLPPLSFLHFTKARTLWRLGQHLDCIAACDNFFAQFPPSKEPDLRFWRCRIAVMSLPSLFEEELYEWAARLCDQVIQESGRRPSGELLLPYVLALSMKGLALKKQRRGRPRVQLSIQERILRHREELQSLGQVRTFEKYTGGKAVVSALVEKAGVLLDLGRGREASATLALLHGIPGESVDAARESLVRSKIDLMTAMWASGFRYNPVECDNLILLCGDAPTQKLRQALAHVMFIKVRAFSEEGKGPQAASLLKKLVRRFGTEPESVLMSALVKSLEAVIPLLIASVRRQLAKGQRSKIDQKLIEVDELIQIAQRVEKNRPRTVFFRSYVSYLKNDHASFLKDATLCVTAGGKANARQLLSWFGGICSKNPAFLSVVTDEELPERDREFRRQFALVITRTKAPEARTREERFKPPVTANELFEAIARSGPEEKSNKPEVIPIDPTSVGLGLDSILLRTQI